MSGAERKLWSASAHERKVENLYAAGIKIFHLTLVRTGAPKFAFGSAHSSSVLVMFCNDSSSQGDLIEVSLLRQTNNSHFSSRFEYTSTLGDNYQPRSLHKPNEIRRPAPLQRLRRQKPILSCPELSGQKALALSSAFNMAVEHGPILMQFRIVRPLHCQQSRAREKIESNRY